MDDTPIYVLYKVFTATLKYAIFTRDIMLYVVRQRI